MKSILFISSCPRRSNTTGLTGKLIESLSELDRTKYEIDLLDTNYYEAAHGAKDFKVERYYSLPRRRWDCIIKKIPYFRSRYAASLAVQTFKKVVENSHYNLVVVFQIPSYVDRYVQICNAAKIKILMYPWGSEILCCSERTKKHIRKAFDDTDFVGGVAKSNCILEAQNEYGVPERKIIYNKLFLPSVSILQKLTGTKSRSQMHEELNIPYSDYNIVCCYNGYQAHNHNIVLDAIINNKSILPKGYQLIFPMTYGATETYYESIRKRCDDYQLNAVFLRKFITDEQMAYLHLVTDLFINIQDSDNGNAFMIEALFAKNRIVTGKWLHYEQFEQYGMPYYLIDKPADLSAKLAEIFSNLDPKPEVPEELIEMYRVPNDYVQGSYWTNIVDKL